MRPSAQSCLLVVITLSLWPTESLMSEDSGPFDNLKKETPIPQHEMEKLQEMKRELSLRRAGKVWDSVNHLRELSEHKQVVPTRSMGLRRVYAHQMLTTTLDASVQELISILDDKGNSLYLRISAAQLLGQIRAPNAVDALLRQMTTVEPVFSFALVRQPCVDSLVQIGKPASRKAIELLHEEEDKRRVGVLQAIIVRVEGRDVAISLLNKEIERASNPKKRERLERALARISKR